MQVLIAVDLVHMHERNKVMVQTSNGMEAVGFVENIEQTFHGFRSLRVRLDMRIHDFEKFFGTRPDIEDCSVATATIVQARLENKK